MYVSVQLYINERRNELCMKQLKILQESRSSFVISSFPHFLPYMLILNLNLLNNFNREIDLETSAKKILATINNKKTSKQSFAFISFKFSRSY